MTGAYFQKEERFFLRFLSRMFFLGVFLSACDIIDPSSTTKVSITQLPSSRISDEVARPDIFFTRENASWSGGPRFGGIWVAKKDISGPNRVRITVVNNRRSVDAALLVLDANDTSDQLRLSSDAAEALGISANQNVLVEVVALRPRNVAKAAKELNSDQAITPKLRPQSLVKNTSLSSRNSKSSGSLKGPVVQIAVFGDEDNADQTIRKLKAKNLTPRKRKIQSGDKPLWRVYIGPFNSAEEAFAATQAAIAAGFKDSYVSLP